MAKLCSAIFAKLWLICESAQFLPWHAIFTQLPTSGSHPVPNRVLLFACACAENGSICLVMGLFKAEVPVFARSWPVQPLWRAPRCHITLAHPAISLAHRSNESIYSESSNHVNLSPDIKKLLTYLLSFMASRCTMPQRDHSLVDAHQTVWLLPSEACVRQCSLGQARSVIVYFSFRINTATIASKMTIAAVN